MEKKRLLNVVELAEFLGWTPAGVRAKVWRREIEFIRVGRSIRFRPEMVERLIDENTIPAREQK